MKKETGMDDKITDTFDTVKGSAPGPLKNYHLFLHKNHIDKLDLEAERQGVKRSQLVRLAIREYVERNGL